MISTISITAHITLMDGVKAYAVKDTPLLLEGVFGFIKL